MERWLTASEVREVWEAALEAAGGTPVDVFEDGQRLFARGVLAPLCDVRPKDAVQGGVAIRSAAADVWVYPYVFRLECKNGAIRAHASQGRHLRLGEAASPAAARREIGQAVRACMAPEVLAEGAAEMRSTLDTGEARIDWSLALMPLLRTIPPDDAVRILTQVMEESFEPAQPRRFAFMNAVTAAARETADPELRWRLEELGGGVPVERPAPVPTRSPGLALGLPRRARELVRA